MINQLVLIEIVGLQFMLDFVLFLVFLPVRNHAISAFSYGNLCNTEIHSQEMSLVFLPVIKTYWRWRQYPMDTF